MSIYQCDRCATAWDKDYENEGAFSDPLGYSCSCPRCGSRAIRERQMFSL
ncbi:MAG: hypothetical protein ABFD07_16490 [Methanobacterium sp.]